MLSFLPPPSPCSRSSIIERRASNAEVEGEIPSGSAISKRCAAVDAWPPERQIPSGSAQSILLQRNANRTSEPGLTANEIVPPKGGLRSIPSTFRQFLKAHECKGVEQQVLQICPSGCESRRGCQSSIQKMKSPAARRGTTPGLHHSLSITLM